MVDLAALKAENEKRWKNAKLTRGPQFARPAKIAVDNKARYVAIAKRAGMPEVAGWVFIACSHYRESSQNFATNLGQGDPWNRRSIHVPAGRGPFTSFEDAAVDALVNCAPYAARLRDWSIGGLLTNLERYNGIGYATKGKPSPYLWAGTDQYRSGKYVADGVYDPNAVDQQLGCAGLILAIMALDPTVKFDDVPTVPSPPLQPPAPAFDGVWLQAALNKAGASLIVDGIVGTDTRVAVKAFQAAHGLAVDGIAGPDTIAALQKASTPPDHPKDVPISPVADHGFWSNFVHFFTRKASQ